MRLAKYLAHAGVASRRAAEELIAAGRVSVDGRDRHRSRLRRRRGEPRWRSTARLLAGPEPRVVYALNKPVGVLSTARDTHGRPTVVELLPARGAAPVSGRAPGRRQQRADPADQRRRARQPPHPSRASRCPKTYRARLGGGPVSRAGAARAARRASSSRTGRPRPARVRRARAAERSRSRSTRAATARCGACARPSGIRCSSWCAPRFGPLRARRPGERASTGACARRRSSACEPLAALTESPPCDCSPCAGAISVERNDAQEILDATTELMQEIMARNALAPEQRRQLHLHRHRRPRRRVPGRRRARARLRARAPAVRPRDPRARLDAARDQGADPLLRRRGPQPAHVYLRRGPGAARRPAARRPQSGPGTMARWRSSSQSASGASPSTRRRAATPSRRRSCAWPATSRRSRRCRRCGRRSTARSAASTATRTRPTRCCAERLSDRYEVPACADRDRQRLVRHPARRRRGAARARRRARLRVALLLGLPAPRGRLRGARGDGRARRRASATTCRRCSREITVATRLVIVCNPNNPTSTALPLARHRGLPRRGPPRTCA